MNHIKNKALDFNFSSAKEIQGYPGYLVDEHGKAYSFSSGKVLKERIDKDGYVVYALYKNGNQKTLKAHRLVAIHFLPYVRNKNTVNHKDGNKRSNHFTNLEWCNVRENVVHAFNHGLRKTPAGLNSKKSILNRDKLLKIHLQLCQGVPRKDIAIRVGITQPHLSLVLTGKRYSEDFHSLRKDLISRGII